MLSIEYFYTVSLFRKERGKKNNLLFVPKYVCADTNSLSSLWTQHGGRLISHSDISVGEWKDGRDARRGHSFYPGPQRRETLALLTWRGGNVTFFLHRDTSHLQIDALSEIDGRRCNECASAAQRQEGSDVVGSRLGLELRPLCFFQSAEVRLFAVFKLRRVGENVRSSAVAGG